MEYNWSIISMECLPSYGEAPNTFTNLVKTVHWSCGGTDLGASFTIHGSSNIEIVGDTFTNYTELTKDEVLSWIWNGPVNKYAIESYVESEINTVNINTVNNREFRKVLPLPWN